MAVWTAVAWKIVASHINSNTGLLLLGHTFVPFIKIFRLKRQRGCAEKLHLVRKNCSFSMSMLSSTISIYWPTTIPSLKLKCIYFLSTSTLHRNNQISINVFEQLLFSLHIKNILRFLYTICAVPLYRRVVFEWLLHDLPSHLPILQQLALQSRNWRDIVTLRLRIVKASITLRPPQGTSATLRP